MLGIFLGGKGITDVSIFNQSKKSIGIDFTQVLDRYETHTMSAWLANSYRPQFTQHEGSIEQLNLEQISK